MRNQKDTLHIGQVTSVSFDPKSDSIISDSIDVSPPV